jgi:hypothetical protein
VELKPCPFCGKKLIHRAGKRVNRYYQGQITRYVHSYYSGCLLDGIEITERDIEKWNRRK